MEESDLKELVSELKDFMVHNASKQLTALESITRLKQNRLQEKKSLVQIKRRSIERIMELIILRILPKLKSLLTTTLLRRQEILMHWQQIKILLMV